MVYRAASPYHHKLHQSHNILVPAYRTIVYTNSYDREMVYVEYSGMSLGPERDPEGTLASLPLISLLVG